MNECLFLELKPKVHLCLVVVLASLPLVHHRLPRAQEGEGVAGVAGVRPICPKKVVAVVVAAAVAEGHHRRCSSQEVGGEAQEG